MTSFYPIFFGRNFAWRLENGTETWRVQRGKKISVVLKRTSGDLEEARSSRRALSYSPVSHRRIERTLCVIRALWFPSRILMMNTNHFDSFPASRSGSTQSGVGRSCVVGRWKVVDRRVSLLLCSSAAALLLRARRSTRRRRSSSDARNADLKGAFQSSACLAEPQTQTHTRSIYTRSRGNSFFTLSRAANCER